MSLSDYMESLAALRVIATDDENVEVAQDAALEWVVDHCVLRTDRVFFVGNGGSAAIASHMAADWMKNGKFAALSLNDGAMLTCISNDIGFREVFALPIARLMSASDTLFAISSSGMSENVLAAVDAAAALGAHVITLSGFGPHNELRKRGDMNFYVPCQQYGLVEIKHLTILHAILDHFMGSKSV